MPDPAASIFGLRGNLADLAATGIASEPTLRKWIAAQPDQPWILKRGSNGDAYEIDLAGAVEAFQAEQEVAAQAARDRAGAIRQLAMDLGVGGRDEEASAIELSIAERRQLLEEEVVAIKLARLRGELVSYTAAQAAFGDVLVMDRQLRRTFSARLAKKVDMTREQLAQVDRLVDADLRAFAAWMGKMEKDLGDRGSPEGGDADPAAAVEDTPV